MMQETILSSSTLVPIGVGGAIIAVLVGLAWKGRGFIADLVAGQKAALQVVADSRDAEVAKLTLAVSNLDSTVKGLAEKLDDHITTMQSKLWIERFRRRNPTLDVPDLE